MLQVLAIRPGIDFALPEGKAAGLVDRTTFSVQVTFTNVNQSQTYTYDIYLVPITAGVLAIANDNTQRTDSVITEQDVARAEAGPKIPIDLHEKLQGGSLWDSIKSVFNKGVGLVEKAVPIVQKGYGIYQQGRKLLGSGLDFSGGKKRRLEGGGFIDDGKQDQMSNPQPISGGRLPVRSAPGSGRLPMRGSAPIRQQQQQQPDEEDDDSEMSLGLPHH